MIRRRDKLLFLACGLAACSSGSAAVATGQQAAPAGAAADADDDFKGCPEDIPPFGPGLRAQGEHLAAKLLMAMPAEPERNNPNRWTVELSAVDGTPVQAATITHGQTFMPVHGHDGRVEPRMTALAEPGQFHIDALSFTMRGPWEVRLWLRAAAVDEELVVFHVCVAK